MTGYGLRLMAQARVRRVIRGSLASRLSGMEYDDVERYPLRRLFVFRTESSGIQHEISCTTDEVRV